jgi:hypothetical protein
MKIKEENIRNMISTVGEGNLRSGKGNFDFHKLAP